MAQIVNLTSFVGTAGQELSAADANWTQTYQGGSGIGTISDAARVYQSSSSEAVYVRSEAPGSANQTVAATIRQVAALSSGNHAGVVARKQSGVNTYITGVLRSESGGRQIRAYKVVGGTATQIGTSVSVTTANGTDYALQLEVTGQSPSLRIVVKLDGTTHIDQTINDTNLDAAGSVGIRFGFGTSASTNTTGLHIATFSASDDTGGDTSPSFTGPNIADISGTESVALTPVDVSSLFFDSESGLTFSAIGSWPAGVTVSSAGVISGTPTTAGTYASLQVRATDAGSLTADSNAFTITVAAPGDAENPTLTGAVTFASVTQTSYTAQWPAGSDNVAVTGYEYQIGSTAGAWTDAGNSLSAAITGRTAGATETVYVRAYDAAGLRSTPAISGSVTLLAATAAVTSDEFKNNTGTLLASATIPKVWLIPFGTPDYTSLVTNGAGELVISEAGLSGDYLIVTANADGTEVGVSKATAS